MKQINYRIKDLKVFKKFSFFNNAIVYKFLCSYNTFILFKKKVLKLDVENVFLK